MPAGTALDRHTDPHRQAPPPRQRWPLPRVAAPGIRRRRGSPRPGPAPAAGRPVPAPPARAQRSAAGTRNGQLGPGLCGPSPLGHPPATAATSACRAVALWCGRCDQERSCPHREPQHWGRRIRGDGWDVATRNARFATGWLVSLGYWDSKLGLPAAAAHQRLNKPSLLLAHSA